MRLIILLILILNIGCDKQPEIKTHPAPYRKFRRMVASEKVPIVAVIDTGFSFYYKKTKAKLCDFGHKNFTSIDEEYTPDYLNTPVPVDNSGHGTNVVGLIQEYAKDAKYCMVILKYYDPKSGKKDNLDNTIKAIKYATEIGAKYINYSSVGIGYDSEEKSAIKKFLDRGGTFVSAAGNEKDNVDIHPYYPATYDSRIISVGSIEKNNTISEYSNFGKKIKRWEYGSNQTAFGVTMSGTSQATAVVTGKIINKLEHSK